MAQIWIALTVLVGLFIVPVVAQDQGCTAVADLCFLLDDSGSIRDTNPADGSYDNWDLLLRFVRLIIDQFDIGRDAVQVGVVVFSDRAQHLIRLDRYRSKDDLKNAISSLRYEGGLTNTYEGLRTLRTSCFGPGSGDRPGSRNVAVVITDGVPTVRVNEWQAEAALVRQEITVFAVGVTNSIDRGTLDTIASNLQNVQTVFSVNDYQGLEAVLETLVEETCQPPIPVCNGLVDLTFLMDVSSSITWTQPANWQLMKDFVDRISQAFPVSPRQAQVAVIRFNDSAAVEFYLNRYASNRAISAAIQRMVHFGGETNIAAALRLARTDVFTASRGDRPGVKNVAIIITDGTANRETNQVRPEAIEARAAGIELFAVGITDDVDVSQLNTIATDPDSRHVFRSSDFSQLTGILSDVIKRSCEVVPPIPGPGVSTPAPTPSTPTPDTPGGTWSFSFREGQKQIVY